MEARLHEWKREWLAHARQLVADTEHRRACERALGPAATERMDASDLRWPGYVGASYCPGGVLMAATVHREFASGRPPLLETERDRLVEATRSWRDQRLHDDLWLAEIQSVYANGLTRHWAVGRLLRALDDKIGLNVAEFAYVNAAKCQVVEQPPPPKAAAIKREVVALCSGDYPLSKLASILQPGALLVVKGTYDVAATALEATGVPVVVVDQRQLCLRAPFPDPRLTCPTARGSMHGPQPCGSCSLATRPVRYVALDQPAPRAEPAAVRVDWVRGRQTRRRSRRAVGQCHSSPRRCFRGHLAVRLERPRPASSGNALLRATTADSTDRNSSA